jgi:hypothetical protein
MSATDIANTVVSEVFWVFFAGGGSQAFYWLAFFIWATNDFKVNKGIIRALVFMPMFRFFGDCARMIVFHSAPKGSTLVWTIPSPLWYTGEIFGDSYLCFKTLSFAKTKFQRYSVMAAFTCFASVKVVNIIFRWIHSFSGGAAEEYYRALGIFDAVTCFVGAASDFYCCSMMYLSSKQLLSFRKSGILMNVKNSSLFRLVLATIIKTICGILFVANPCDSDQDACKYGFLRSVIITVDYQFYYMDYFFSRYHSNDKITNETTNLPEPSLNVSNNNLKTSNNNLKK